MSLLTRLRRRLDRPAGPYERLWLRTVNAVGLTVLVAVLLDLGPLLGEGQSGVFRRALYPLVPPGVVLGVALAERVRRQVLLAAAAIGGYLLLLALVGTAGAAVAAGPAYPLAAAGIVGLTVLAGLAYGRWRPDSARRQN